MSMVYGFAISATWRLLCFAVGLADLNVRVARSRFGNSSTMWFLVKGIVVASRSDLQKCCAYSPSVVLVPSSRIVRSLLSLRDKSHNLGMVWCEDLNKPLLAIVRPVTVCFEHGGLCTSTTQRCYSVDKWSFRASLFEQVLNGITSSLSFPESCPVYKRSTAECKREIFRLCCLERYFVDRIGVGTSSITAKPLSCVLRLSGDPRQAAWIGCRLSRVLSVDFIDFCNLCKLSLEWPFFVN